MPPISPSLLGVLLATVMALPASAHKTEVSGNVAGTWHLEPNHSPKAGELAQVWVALTLQGGTVIPLEQCDCHLAVYNANQPDSPPVMVPTLEAMSPETFQSIPGANVTFPAVGEYRLVLTGSPKANAAFTPFELSYTTIVAAGSTTATPPTPQGNNEPSGTPPGQPVPLAASPADGIAPTSQPQPGLGAKLWVIGGVAVGAAIASLIFLRQQRKDPPR
jgi:hypothetical protein